MSASTQRHRRIRAGLITTALAGGLIGLTAAPATAEPTAAPAGGYVVAIGGAVSPGEPYSDAIIQRIVDLAQQHAGPNERPRIAVLTTASEVATDATVAADWQNEDNATANGLYYADWFSRFDVDVYPVPIDVNPGEDYPGDPYSADNAMDPEVAAEIAASDAVYFGGGDQINYVRALMECTAPDADAAAIYAYTSCTDTPAMAAIRGVVESGGVSAGTSAGLTIQQGAQMITGGDPYPAWRDGATPGWFSDDRLAYVPSGGFGFFTEGMLDSHFARRDRQPRIVRLALQLERPLSFGVEEKTALVVNRANRTGEVIGQLGVSLLDTSAATSDGTNAAGVSYSYLTPGSTFDFASGNFTLAGSPSTEPGSAAPPAAPTDIWGSGECEGGIFGTLDLAQGLVASSAHTAFGDSCDAASETPRFRTTFTRGANTEWNAAGGFTHLGMAVTGIPALSATAQVVGASESGSLPTGSTAEISVTVTNTGGTPLAQPTLTGSTSAGDATAAAPDAAPLMPGASTTLSASAPVAEGTQTFTGNVTAAAVDASGTDLGIAAATQAVTVDFVGATAVTPPVVEPPVVDPPTEQPTVSADPNGVTQLSRTGSSDPAPALALSAALLAAAAGTLALNVRRRKRSRA